MTVAGLPVLLSHMERKDHIDAVGAAFLIGFALLLATNQVVIKVTVDGIGPVFQAALRSVGATLVLLVWMRFRGIGLDMSRPVVRAGVITGSIFAFEFMCLYNALDLTSVSRASVIFYSMPVWLAVASHVLLPAERLSPVRTVGLVLAMAGVVVAMSNRDGGDVSWAGDVLALTSALCWAAIALMARLSPISKVSPVEQLFWQVAVSGPILLLLAPLLGDLIRDVQPIHIAGLVFQIFAVASFGFLLWFWLLKIYPASGVASFSFLSPIFSVALGWLLLNEDVGPELWVALALVAGGIFLINRKPA